MMRKFAVAKCCGNAYLEMLLFAPLGALFFFAAIDAGFVFVEKAAMADALRAGINSEILRSKERAVFSMGEDLEVTPNDQSAMNLINTVANAISENARRIHGIRDNQEPDSFAVKVSLVLLEIDPETGSALPSSLTNPTIFGPVEYGSFDLKAVVPEYPLVSMKDFIISTLAKNDSMAESSYAIPTSRTSEPNSPEESNFAYLDASALLYVEITSLTRGIAPPITKSILGRFYALQKQQLHFLRTQLR